MPIPSPAQLVREFHDAFGLHVSSRPARPPDELAALRQRLLSEEVAELGDAVAGGELSEIAHELADVVYVAYGTALTYGIDLDAVVAEVHRANLTKLGPDGRPKSRPDGKVLKSEHYQRPDVETVLRRQSENG